MQVEAVKQSTAPVRQVDKRHTALASKDCQSIVNYYLDLTHRQSVVGD